MATADKGGVTAGNTTTTNFSYGGGGKFRKKPFRHQTTPYDRPPTVPRENSNVGWLAKLVVDPASKLISYGAHRLFGSILQRRLPPPSPSPSPTQAPEVNHDFSGGFQGVDPSELKVIESSPQELKFSGSSQLINNSTNDGIAELEQFLKQNTFTRSEIDHLTELLHSRAAEEREKEEATSVFCRLEKISGGPSDENRNERIRFHGATSTPIFKSKVLEDNIDSPAELAKAFMGSRPSKASPSMLGMNNHREDTGLINNIPFTSKSPIVPFTRKSSVSHGATKNGFITPRSCGRSAVYNMARTPYSRVHPTSIVKGDGINNNDVGQSTPSSSLSLLEHGEIFEPKSTILKRRSSFLDDEVGSVGPIRRIRQKHNLLAPRVPHSGHRAEIGSAKQKLSLIGQGNHEPSKAAVENGSISSTSYASVPSKSSEVASRILQHLEKLSPKDKPSGSKSAAVDKSPFKLTPGMLRGQALKSVEDVGTSKVMLDVQDDSKTEDRHKANFPDAHDSTSQKHEKVEESRGKKSVAPTVLGSPARNNNFKVPLIISGPSTAKADSVIRNGASQPPPQKRAFRMSALEDSFEQEDDVHNNRVTLGQSSESKGPMQVPLMEHKLSTPQDPKIVKATIQPEVKLTLGFELSERSEFGVPGSGKFGESSGGIAICASEEVNKVSQSAVLPPAATAFDKPKHNPPPVFSFSSKVSDKFPPLPSESSSKTPEPKLDSANSFINTSAPNGSQLKTSESQNGDLDPLKAAGDKFGKSDTALPATNGPIFGSQPPAFSLNAVSPNDTNQVSTGVGIVSTSSTSIANFASTATGNTTSVASTGSIFVSTGAPATSPKPVFKFGSSTDPSTSVSAPSAANHGSEIVDAKRKLYENQSFGSSNPTVASFSSASSGSSIFGLISSTGSMISSASKSISSDETVLQGSSVQPASSSSLPSFTTNTSTPFGSSFSNSQPFNSKSTSQFGLSSPSDTNSIAPVSEPTSTVTKFGASFTAASDNNAVTSNSNSSPGIFTFGLTSSPTSTNTIGSSTAATSSPLIFGGSSVINTSSSFGSGTSGVFNFGGSMVSSASSSAAVSSITSSSAPNVFGSFQSSPIIGSTFASSSPSTGFAFGGSSAFSAPTNTAPSIFTTSSPSGPASTPIFSFSASSAPAIPTQPRAVGSSSSPMFQFAGAPAPALSTPSSQSVFGAPAPGFGAFLGNNNQMNAEDSMAEDPVNSTPVFGQPAPSPGAFMFGQTAPPAQPANLFHFGGQSSGIGSVNPNPFQASSSLEFNTGGSFSLGSGGGDKSNRRTVRVSKNKNRRK